MLGHELADRFGGGDTGRWSTSSTGGGRHHETLVDQPIEGLRTADRDQACDGSSAISGARPGWPDEHGTDDARGGFETFFAEAPRPNPDRELIKGVVCGVRVEDVEEPTMREIRYLDKLVDELARGKAMEKILRA